MRVLIVHSRYRSGVSGENRVVDDEARLLLDGGHDVQLWDPSPAVGGLALVRTAAGAVWSRSASTEIRRLVQATGAEVVHCHNLFPVLSPAVLRAAASEGAAVVVTLHNYRMLCLPADFRREGLPCEDCLGHVPWRGVVHRCYRGSALGSGALATSLALHRTLGTFDAPRMFLAVSRFVRQKHIDAGWAPERITVKPNFSWPAPRRDRLGDYFVYLGRLSQEKGIAELVTAWRGIPAKLLVVGTGPQESEMRSVAPPQVEFRGLVAATEVPSILAGARALMVPSMCYEGQPRSVLEAYAAGRPVVAHRIGGLPEVVIDGETGLLVDPADERAWSDAVLRLLDDGEAERLGEGAYRCWKDHYSPKRGLQLLEVAYREALAKA
jgi:glycosyltransferase involved in cell wall biosynthesis